ncbi:MAG: DUF4105 domain-containing protein [Gemmatimonadales bacterium]
MPAVALPARCYAACPLPLSRCLPADRRVAIIGNVKNRSSCVLVVAVLLQVAIAALGSSGRAQEPKPDSTGTDETPANSSTPALQAPPALQTPPATSPESTLEIFLITVGAGRQVWERFGHNAIWVRDTVRGIDRAYNYGMFSFDDPGFLSRFVRGEMDYWMEGFETERMLRAYEAADRSIWIQELDLTAEQKRALYEFEQWNERPENRVYRYDYYRDNCSTRVRDALDRVLDGRLRETFEGVETGTTYRSHFRRLMSPDPLIYTGGSFAIGPATDRPISAWEEMFLPVRMMEYLREMTVPDGNGGEKPLVKRELTFYESTLGPEPMAPPDWRLQFLAVGVSLAGLFVLLGWLGSRWRGARFLAALTSTAWALVLGIGGVFMLGIWFLTAHWAGYRNENLFFLNPLALALVVLIPYAALAKPWAVRWARGLATFLAAAAILGLILQPLPWLPQTNAEIIAAVLPPTLAMTWVVLRLTRDPGGTSESV